jgi:hypothetical protein
MFSTTVAPRLIFILGITNLLSGLFVFFTCRCLPGWKLTRPLMQHAWYQKVFKWHCTIWWIFWISVVVHAIFAIGFYGAPI